MKLRSRLLLSGLAIVLASGLAASNAAIDDEATIKELKEKLDKAETKLKDAQKEAEAQKADRELTAKVYRLKFDETERQRKQVEGMAAALAEQKHLVEVNFDKMKAKTQALVINSLKHSQPEIRRWGAETVGEIATDLPELVPHLTKLLKDSDESVRKAAGAALKKIDPEKAAKEGVK